MPTARQTAALRQANDEAKLLTRESIRGALFQLLQSKPYDKITVTDLVKRAGVSRSAFYRNYEKIDDILDEGMELVGKEIQDALGDDIRANWPELFYVVERHKETLKVLIGAGLENRILTHLNKNLPSSGERYILPAFLNGALSNLIIQWVMRGVPATAAEMTHLVETYTMLVRTSSTEAPARTHATSVDAHTHERANSADTPARTRTTPILTTELTRTHHRASLKAEPSNKQ